MAKKAEGTDVQGVDKAFIQCLQELADASEKLDQFTFSNELTDDMIEVGKKVLNEVNKRCSNAIGRKKSKINVLSFLQQKPQP